MNAKRARSPWMMMAIVSVLAGGVQAATITYNTTNNWSSQTVNPADTVIINANGYVTLDQNTAFSQLRVNNSVSPATGTLIIDQNYTLTVTNEIQIGLNTGAGTIKQSAGTVNSTKSLFINHSQTGDACLYEISGGSLSASTLYLRTNGTLNVKGDAPTISFSALAAAAAGTFKFNVTNAGISKVGFTGTGNIDLSTTKIIIDGAGYTGGSNTFNLFTFGSNKLTGQINTNVNLTVTGFQDYTLTQNSASGVISLTVIPEPTTVGLFFVASCSVFLMRRMQLH